MIFYTFNSLQISWGGGNNKNKSPLEIPILKFCNTVYFEKQTKQLKIPSSKVVKMLNSDTGIAEPSMKEEYQFSRDASFSLTGISINSTQYDVTKYLSNVA